MKRGLRFFIIVTIIHIIAFFLFWAVPKVKGAIGGGEGAAQEKPAVQAKAAADHTE